MGRGERIVNSCTVPVQREKKELDAKRQKINRQQNPTQPAWKLPSAAFIHGAGRGHSLGPRAAQPAQAGVQDQRRARARARARRDEGEGEDGHSQGEAPRGERSLRPALRLGAGGGCGSGERGVRAGRSGPLLPGDLLWCRDV